MPIPVFSERCKLDQCNQCCLPYLDDLTIINSGKVSANHNCHTFNTHFQEIKTLKDETVLGHEALVRISNGKQSIDTTQFFHDLKEPQHVIQADRLCRTIHVRNYVLQNSSANLFLNLDPRLAQHLNHCQPYFDSLIDKYNIDPQKIVIEIVESHIPNIELLPIFTKYFKALGCKIAIDDFGSNNSNFDRLWALEPDYIKLDKHFVKQIMLKPNAHEFTHKLLNLLHEFGEVIMEGIETQEEYSLAQETGIDYVQGYFIHKPAPEISRT